jgi:hypothetical protein
MNNLVSVVIPVAPWDKQWKKLLPDLTNLPNGTEIIFSCAGKELPSIDCYLKDKRVKLLLSEDSRANCLNRGAEAVTSKYIWFLHADSRFTKDAYVALEKSIKKYPYGLHYFNIRFLTDGSSLMLINELGARLRSKFFGTPFGDQGLCIKTELFKKIGGFPADAEYGEDHLFVWYARQAGIKLYCTGEDVLTSARKYKNNNWLKVTLKHQVMWITQALPQWKKLKNGL